MAGTGVPYFPQTLPANSVVGRLAPNSGPTEAIPFTQLSAALGIGGSNYLLASNIAGTNTVTGTVATAPALAANQVVFLIPANTNTGAVTFDRDAQGTPKSVFWNGAALVGGELRAGIPVAWFYDGTQYHLLSEQSFSDGSPVLVNAADITKKLKFSLSAIGTGTTRTITMPNTDIDLTGARKQPTRQIFTSGTAATYTTPAGATRITVRMVGGGGGGGGGGTGGGAGTAGNNSTFSTLTASGGGAGTGAAAAAGGVGGGASGGDINLAGGSGGGSSNQGVGQPGGHGGNSAFGGGGGAGNGGNSVAAPAAAGANTGGGGGGGPTNQNVTAGGSGGGAGGYCEKLITAPAATYTYTVGASAAGGSAGTNGLAGGAGAAGIIIVEEAYN